MPIHDWTRVGAGLYHHFHQRWSSAICDGLNEQSLPNGFHALLEQNADGPIPDVLTVQSELFASEQSKLPAKENWDDAGGVAISEAPPKVSYKRMSEIDAYALKANRIAIHHPLGEVVAIVELVSPGNKASRNGLHTFIRKVNALIRAGIHVLVIDLFPPTPRDPSGIHKAIWDEIEEEPFDPPADRPLTLAAYCAGTTVTAYIEPVGVGGVLMDMPIFLTTDRYVPVPLETTYNTTFEKCPAPMRAMLE